MATQTTQTLFSRPSLWVLTPLAVISALWVAQTKGTWGPPVTLAVLAALATCAELLPVELHRKGFRVTFTLPYIAAIGIVAGLVPALLAEIAVTVLGSLVMGPRRHVSEHFLNVLISICAIGFGGAGAEIVGGHPIAQALAFILSYSAANLGLILVVNLRAEQQHVSQYLTSLKVGLPGYVAYLLIGVTVTAVAEQDVALLLPLTLLPIWAVRTALDYQAKMYDHYYGTLSALSLMLQRAHPYTHGHLERVANIAEDVAYELGLPPARAKLVKEAAVLHDIGKIAVSEEILDKPAKLTEEEFEHVKRHAALGAEILAPVQQFHQMARWIRHHHERMDGRGYPDGLTAVEIPIESKIIAVVDAFDAMTDGDHAAEKRTYREPKTQEQAIEELERCSGTQFDGDVVQAFKHVLLGGGAWTR